MHTAEKKPEQPQVSYPLRKMRAIVRRTELHIRIVFWMWMAAIAVTLACIVWYYVL